MCSRKYFSHNLFHIIFVLKHTKKKNKCLDENDFLTHILNNNISNETLLRQEEILTKLLEAEESQRERGEEEKRESIEWNYEIKNNN